MSAFSRGAAEVEHELGAAWTRYHVGAQAVRLVSGVAGSVLWAALHSGVSDWTALVPVASGALWATLAQMFPQVPWSLLREHFGITQLDRASPPGSAIGVAELDATVKTHPGLEEALTPVPVQPDGAGVVSNPARAPDGDPAPPSVNG